MYCLNFSTSILPVGLVNDFNPLGHSGQAKLHAVVGSTDIAIGSPHIIGRFIHLLNQKDEYTLKAFTHLNSVSLATKLKKSLTLGERIGVKLTKLRLGY
jgi:hypothetical protein